MTGQRATVHWNLSHYPLSEIRCSQTFRHTASIRFFHAFRPATLALALFLFTPAGAYSDDMPGTNTPDTDVSVMDGAGITITASNPEPGTVRVTREEIERSTGPDLVTLLTDTAGIGMTSHGGYGTVNALSVRGLSTSRIQVRIDGVIVSSPQSGDFDFTSIDKNSVESITLRYGGSAVVTVDITTRKIRETGFTWSTGFSNTAWLPPDITDSLMDTQRLDVSLGWSGTPVRFRLNAFGTRAQNQFPFENTGNTVLRTGNEMVDGGISITADSDITPLVSLFTSVSLYHAEKNVAGPITTVVGGEQEDFRSRETVSITAKQFLSPAIWAQFTVSHGATHLEWEEPETTSRHILHSIEGSSFWKFFPADSLDVRINAIWKHDVLDSSNTGDARRDTVILESGGDWHLPRDFTASVDCSLMISPSLDTPGLMPSLTLSRAFGGGFTTGFRIFRTLKMPDMNALYWAGDSTAKGNPDLINESALGAELFVSRASSGQFRSEHSLYTTWYRDAIIWQAAAGLWSPENVGKALYIGSEHRLIFTPEDGITLTLNYAWLFTRALTGAFSFSDGKRMPYQSEHRFSIRMEKSTQQYRWHIAPRYESARYTTIMNATKLPGIFLLDAGITVHAGKHISLFLDGRNLLNEQWMSMDGYPMPTRSVTAGIRLSDK